MPWVQVLVLLAVIYVVVVVVRGLIQIGPWFIDEFIEPRRLARAKEKHPPHLPPAGPPHSSVSAHHARKGSRFGFKDKAAVALLRITDRLAGSLGFLRRLFSRKDFGYWVGLAIIENDPNAKVKYCSKALELKPEYEPAWGMKAITLLRLQRYDEALGCFDKVLQMHPSAMAWHQRGLCCYHLDRHEEAVTCFDKALAACSDQNPELFDDATRHKQLAEDAWRQQGIAKSA
jgi:tetratricopeptide (TPR) repeat protein